MSSNTNVTTPANLMLFEDLCTVYDLLLKTKRTYNKYLNANRNQKQEQSRVLENFINNFKVDIASTLGEKNTTFFPILRLLLPNYDRERGPYNLKEKNLGALLVKVLSLSKQSDVAKKLLNYRSVDNSQESDFAGVAYFALKNNIRTKDSRVTIGTINEVLDKIANAEVGSKGSALDEAFGYAMKNLTAEQFKWFLRLILKDLKIGMGSDRILAAFHPDAPEHYQNCSSLLKVCEELEDGDTRPLEMGVKVFYAINPMLSERLDITQVEQHIIFDRASYIVENKFDGERFQIHMENEKFEYFSRKGHKYSDNYGSTYDSGLLTPFLKGCLNSEVTSFILDGEMMGWHKVNQHFGCKGMAFDIKKITDHSSYRPCFCAFDILYYNGRSLVGPKEKGGITLKERLKILDSLFTPVTGVIQHSVRETVKNSTDLLHKLNKAIEDQEEGIVVKDVGSYYIPSRRNAGWYKIKPEYTESTMTDLDLVIIGADEAANKKQGRAKCFHVACIDKASPDDLDSNTRWMCVGRVVTGLSHEEKETLCCELQKYWKPTRSTPPPPQLVFNKEKPDFWIMPEHSTVLQVRATELIPSTSYGTEYTLRFPRVVRVRNDKPVIDVMTLAYFDSLTPVNNDLEVANRFTAMLPFRFIAWLVSIGGCDISVMSNTSFLVLVTNVGVLSSKGYIQDKIAITKLSSTLVNPELMGKAGPKVRRKRPAKEIQVAEQFRTTISETVAVNSKALLGKKICIFSDNEACKKQELIKIVMSHSGNVVSNIGPDTWCAVVGKINQRERQIIKSQTQDVVGTSWLVSLPPSEVCCTIHPLDMLAMKKSTRLSLCGEYDTFGDSYTEPTDVELLKKCFMRMDERDQNIYLTKQEMLNLDCEIFATGNPYFFLRPCYIHVSNNSSFHALKARIFGASVCDLHTPNLTHVVICKNTNMEELEKLKKSQQATIFIVSEEWLEECFRKRTYVSESDFLL